MKKVTFAVVLSILCVALNAKAENLSLQKLSCYIKNGKIELTVAMPSGWKQTQIEKESKRICDSIQESSIHPESTSKTGAVCDTDYNCEVLLEKNKKNDVTKVFIAPDEHQKGKHKKRILEVYCKNFALPKFVTEDELSKVCKSGE